MIISTRGRYALRVMIDLSQQDPESYTPLKEIAARQEISEKYLENISEYIIENYVDIEYCETISGYEKEIFIIKFNNITKKFF